MRPRQIGWPRGVGVVPLGPCRASDVARRGRKHVISTSTTKSSACRRTRRWRLMARGVSRTALGDGVLRISATRGQVAVAPLSRSDRKPFLSPLRFSAPH